jgi:Flp pilus assembly pilin Flp
MLDKIRRWFRSAARRRGQSLIEYTLLLGFIALACCALVYEVGDGVLGIGEEGDEVLASANGAAPDSPTTQESGGGTSATSGGTRRHSHHRWHH